MCLFCLALSRDAGSSNRFMGTYTVWYRHHFNPDVKSILIEPLPISIKTDFNNNLQFSKKFVGPGLLKM